MNTDNAKIMYQPPPLVVYKEPTVSINGVSLKPVSKFTYFASDVSRDNSAEIEASRRIRAASEVFGRLKAKV